MAAMSCTSGSPSLTRASVSTHPLTVNETREGACTLWGFSSGTPLADAPFPRKWLRGVKIFSNSALPHHNQQLANSARDSGRETREGRHRRPAASSQELHAGLRRESAPQNPAQRGYWWGIFR